MAGAVGLWAVSFHSARAAKAYMLWWPAGYLIGLFMTLQAKVNMRKFGVEVAADGSVFLWQAGRTFLLFYYFKVRSPLLHEAIHVSNMNL